MVSIGTDASRAFAYIVRNVALLLMSLPPSRAATSTWRRILANTLARFWSLAPFWCLIVAHLEWPLMRVPPGTAGAVVDRCSARGGTSKRLWRPIGRAPRGPPPRRRRRHRRRRARRTERG